MLVVEIQSKHETGCSRLRLRTPTVRTDIDEDQRRGRTRNCGRAQPVQDVVTEPRAYGALDSRTSPLCTDPMIEAQANRLRHPKSEDTRSCQAAPTYWGCAPSITIIRSFSIELSNKSWYWQRRCLVFRKPRRSAPSRRTRMLCWRQLMATEPAPPPPVTRSIA